MTEPVRMIDTSSLAWGDWHPQFPGTLVEGAAFRRRHRRQPAAGVPAAGLHDCGERSGHHHGGHPRGRVHPVRQHSVPRVRPADDDRGVALRLSYKGSCSTARRAPSTASRWTRPATLGCMILEMGHRAAGVSTTFPFERRLSRPSAPTSTRRTLADSESALPWAPHPGSAGLQDQGAVRRRRRRRIPALPPGLPRAHPAGLGAAEYGASRQRAWTNAGGSIVLHGDAPVWTYPDAQCGDGRPSTP